MAVLDNAFWLTGSGGTAVSGSTVISEGGYSTNVTGTFTANTWDASQGGNNISEFGAFAVSSPINANYQFSSPVENLSFDFNHINDDGGSTYDDMWTIYAYDENGTLIPASTVIAGLSGLVDETIVTNGDGSVSIIASGTTANDVSLNLAGPISELDLTLEPGPGGTLSGGSGISDLTFDIPAVDTDGDGVFDATDIDDDNDGILDTDEFESVTPSTITITFDGDEWATTDNTRWELRAPDGTLIASDTKIDSTVEITNVDITQFGDWTFTINDDFGDGLGGSDPASYTIAIDGVTVINSGPNPGGFSTRTETISINPSSNPVDTDGDGIFDHHDLDSDNDGITDNIEAQTTAGYVAPTGTDSDGDGLDDAYEGTGDDGLIPVDSDGDGTADFIDTDSDNDLVNDVNEAGHGVTQAVIDASGDADGDGIADAVDDVVGWDVNDADIDGAGIFALTDSDNDVLADGSDATPLSNDLDFRDNVACFTPGTLITTAIGERPIEDLRPGDLVQTVDHGLQPLRWIARTVLSQAELAANLNLRPIIIRKHAFGNRRRMVVSPQHGMVMRHDGKDNLIRAKHAAEMLAASLQGSIRNVSA